MRSRGVARTGLTWLARKIIRGELLHSAKGDMQVFHGMQHGIISDGQLNMEELRVLQKWLSEHDHLREIWPYDEIELLLTSTLADGVLDQIEHKMLMALLQDFCVLKPDESAGEIQHAVSGICAV